jgi:two-component sensor histidine kinase/HAMP domain-containing protein/putative methionine-R-sulfoxide reductase with GAF domain
LAINAVDSVLTQNIMDLYHLIEEIKKEEEEIVYIYILDSKQSLLVHTFESGFPMKLAGINTPAKNRKYSHKLLETEEGYIRDFAVPIVNDLGVVHVGMSENIIRQTVTRTTSALLIMTLVMMVLGILITSFITVWILKPLESLTLAAKKIGHGNFDYKIQPETKDEIGILATAFKNMVKELSKHRQHLQELVEERTAALKKINEDLGNEVAVRKRAENEIQRKHQIQSALNKMLSISMKPHNLEEILDYILNLVVSIPTLTLKPIGAIFLVDSNRNNLIMKSSFGLPPKLKTLCAKVPFGRCLCGKAALTKKIQFANSIDARHENQYEGISPHGHYCVPILSSGKVLGVLNLYVKQEQNRNQEEEDFLQAIANVTAGIIERKLAEEELSKHRNYLERLVKKRTAKLAKINENLKKEITERKQAEDKIKRSLKEKQILLQEIYHRTKNNMGVICSLLKLQSADVGDKKLEQIFNETENRIRAMSLVHEKLYQSKDLSNINLNDYIQDLANGLLRNYDVNSQNISLSFDTDDVSISIDSSVPLGLVINELLSNSLKHAFPNNRKGKISIALHSMPDDSIELTIGDNGIGLPTDYDFRNSKNLGMQLITGLAENQLKAMIERIEGEGTKFKIVFFAKQHTRIPDNEKDKDLNS